MYKSVKFIHKITLKKKCQFTYEFIKHTYLQNRNYVKRLSDLLKYLTPIKSPFSPFIDKTYSQND